MNEHASFADLMAGLRRGEEGAVVAVHRKFMHRLVALAYRQFDTWVRTKADHEDVVQSVFQTFFARCARDEFDLGSWDAVWALLAVITVRKCGRRRDHLGAGRRDVSQEFDGTQGRYALDTSALDREPTPEHAAILTETLSRWLGGLEPADRRVVELGLQGQEDAEVARQLLRSERTVRRVRARAEERLSRDLLRGKPGRALSRPPFLEDVQWPPLISIRAGPTRRSSPWTGPGSSR